MRIDQATLPDQLEVSKPEGRPATVNKPRAQGRSNVMLALLMAGTSWAIASCASIWLVPPYLFLMAWLLYPSSNSRPSAEPGASRKGDPDPLRSAKAGGTSDEPSIDPFVGGPASAGSPEDIQEPAPSSSPPKARRGKGRARKVRPIIEPSEATWVQVAPGKFVRVEASEASTPPGPFGDPPIDPVEPDVISPLSVAETEPFQDASATFDALESPEGEPSRLVESESPTAETLERETRSLGTFEEALAADGIAPQAGESTEVTEAGWLEPPDEALDDQPEAEPSAERIDDEGERSPESEAFEPAGLPGWTDVMIEEDEEEPGDSTEEADPTETTVDETDFDDAGPFHEDPSDFPATLETVDDEPETVTPHESPSKGSNCWPWRLAPRRLDRAGHPPRTFERPATSRRPVRSSGLRPRPSGTPRRQGRREPGRPRRITRAFPPRSPPASVFLTG